MTPAEVAADYRIRGQYELALATARAGVGADARAEEARALVRLGRTREALEVARTAGASGILAQTEALLAAGEPGEARAVLASMGGDQAYFFSRGGEFTPAEDERSRGGPGGAPRDPGDAVSPSSPAPERVEETTRRALAAGPRTEPGRPRLRSPAADDSPASDPPRATPAEVLELEASVLLALGEVERAFPPAVRAVALSEGPAKGLALGTLAGVHHAAGHWDEAARRWREARRVLSSFEPDHPELAVQLDGLGNTLRRDGRARDAVRLHREALATHRRLRDPLHPAIGACHHALAQALHRTGDFAAARAEMAEATRLAERREGPDHLDTWISRFELGRFEVDTGEVEAGFARMTEARQRVAARLGREHPTVRAMDRWL